jgi:hypothetical protein
MKYGINPITIKKEHIKKWLTSDTDNIVFILENLGTKYSVFCLKKSYFLNPQHKDLYKYCSFDSNHSNKQLLVDETYKSDNYIEIGHFIGSYLLVQYTPFIKALQKSNTFVLTVSNELIEKIKIKWEPGLRPGTNHPVKHKKRILNVDIPVDKLDDIAAKKDFYIKYIEKQPTFINLNLLEEAHVGLKKLDKKLQIQVFKVNIPTPVLSTHWKKYITKQFKSKQVLTNLYNTAKTEEVYAQAIKKLNKDQAPVFNSIAKAIGTRAQLKKYLDNYHIIYDTYINYKNQEVEVHIPYDNGPGTYKHNSQIQVEVFENIYDQNLPVKEDVYFRTHMIDALYDYTLPVGWDFAINTYLREGSDFFGKKAFLDKLNVYGNPNFQAQKAMIENAAEPGNEHLANDIIGSDECEELIIKNKLKVSNPVTKNQIAYILPSLIYYIQEKSIKLGIKNVKKHIKKIDKCFLHAAPRVTSKMVKTKYFRGMTQKYDFDLANEIIVKNYISISPKLNIAKKFGIEKQKKPDADNTVCCLYQFHLTQGIPYINMINNTKYAHESEILLPRDLKLTLFNSEKVFYKTINGGQTQIYYNHYHVRVSLQNKEQFKNEHKCITFNIADIKPIKLDKKLTSVTPPEKIPGVLQMHPKNVNKELKKQAKMYDKETGEEKQEEDDVSDDEWEEASNAKQKQAKMFDKETGEEKIEEEDAPSDWEDVYEDIDDGSNEATKADLAICKGLSEAECNKLKHCTYSKGAKRQFCRNNKTKKKSVTKKNPTPKAVSNKKSSGKKSLKCKGLSEVECNKLDECIYSKGAKRQFCRTRKNK